LLPDLADSVTGLEDNSALCFPSSCIIVDMIFWSLHDYSIRDNVHMKIVVASFNAYGWVGSTFIKFQLIICWDSWNSFPSWFRLEWVVCFQNGTRGRVFWFCSWYPWLI